MNERSIINRIVAAETGDKEEYQKFFEKKLKEHGVSSPNEFKTEKEKKDFFNEIDKEWDADQETD